MAQEKPSTEIDFGELKNQEKLTALVLKLNASLDGTKAHLEALAKCDVEKLCVKDQVMLDLFLAYTVNSLYWMFLRTKGINPATHPIKSEINRIREAVGRANRICSRKQPTTRLNKEAAKRFIRSGLWKAGEKPAGGVVKKFDSTSVEEKASSSSSNANDEGVGAKQLKAPHANVERVIKQFDCITVTEEIEPQPSFSKANNKGGGTKRFKTPMKNPDGTYNTVEFTNSALTSFSKVNKKGGGTKHFKSPNWKSEGGFPKSNPNNAGGVQVSKGGGTKHFKSPNWKSEGDFPKLSVSYTDAEQASSSFSQVNKKGGETGHFKAPNRKPEGDFPKLSVSYTGQASSSFTQVNKKGDETGHFKVPNRKPEGGFQKFNPNYPGGEHASSSFKVYKKGGETKRLNSPNGKTGKKSNHNPYQYKKDEKLN